ncbi:MAG: hypothetical protein HPY73_05685 [Methanomassiliicoccales archaeon]|nr:MAG: hypothetical protein HPY73_05685 [Methanomassiliicoccales archaeon]
MTITIVDGNGTSVSKVSTLSVVRTVLTEQYANASFSSLQIATLTESDATLTVQLKSGTTVLDSYTYELPISSDAPRGVISAWIPAIMGLMVTLAVVSVIFKLFEKWQV